METDLTTDLTTGIAFPIGTMLRTHPSRPVGIVTHVTWGQLRPYLVEFADRTMGLYSERELSLMERIK